MGAAVLEHEFLLSILSVLQRIKKSQYRLLSEAADREAIYEALVLGVSCGGFWEEAGVRAKGNCECVADLTLR
jgi:hypothetical protein